MMDDADDTLEIATRTWNRVVNTAEKEGYREGVEEGSDDTFQEDFDKGYVDGFKIAFILGHYKGLAAFLFNDIEHPKDITDVLENTKRGVCYICILQSKRQIQDDDEKVLEDHREHTIQICKKLKAYFDPLLKSKGMDYDVTKKFNI